MTFTFDLISDLHVDTWPGKFSWEENVTSPYCVVAGDIAHDRETVLETLHHLGQCYQAVFYIDGNVEHYNTIDNLGAGYKTFARQLQKIPNVVYLQDNVAIIDNIALVGTNGWWGFDFDPSVNYLGSIEQYQEAKGFSDRAIRDIEQMHKTDAKYLLNAVQKLQELDDIHKIVIVTHTVPNPDLIAHDAKLSGHLKFNTMGNSLMPWVISADVKNKIHTWCFGHYHGDVDQVHDNIRYVNNCRGKGTTPHGNHAYYAKRIVISL